ncbi:MAG: beta-propeller domain-containing protein, partial [Polyangiales bacterium]
MASLAIGSSGLMACGAKTDSVNANVLPTGKPVRGQSVFVSTSFGGRYGGNGAGGSMSDGTAPTAGAVAGTGGAKASTPAATSSSRTVQETDLYRVDGNRLYYLNSYRGLMIFDITNVDAPVLIGRSPIFGTPVDMVVNAGMASVIVGDWYGRDDLGAPFHGSIVRGLDATDPSNIKVTGEARLGGWVQDSRLVGNILYTIAQDYGWEYGWDYYYGYGYGGVGTSSSGAAAGPTVTISAVNIQAGGATLTGQQAFPGSSAIFNVSQNAIILASALQTTTSGYPYPNGLTQLQYVDISDPGGAIALDGAITIHTEVQGWGADNGRWNLDFDPTTNIARAFGCGNGTSPASYYWYCDGTSYTLSTVDFSDKNNPKISSEIGVPGTNWSPTARFDTGRVYIAPGDGYYYTGPDGTVTTPINIYDTSNPAAPKLAGSTSVGGNISLFMPAGNRLFALGNSGAYSSAGNPVTLSYLDVSNPTKPSLIGTSAFGTGWASSEATNTFKAFTMDPTQGLVVLPFSGWSDVADRYNDGVQLLEYTPTALSVSGTGYTNGYVERGIFAGGRLLSLSDLSLGVFDYSDHAHPIKTAELTLARNVVDAHAQGANIAELSSDWWGNDTTTSQMRVLPVGNAEEDTSAALSTATIPGVDARSFRNGTLSYVVTDVQHPVPCGGPSTGPYPSGGTSVCTAWTQQVNVVDTTAGVATVRGSIALPDLGSYYYWNWWGGYWYYDWYNGDDVVQVGNDALAFRRWYPVYSTTGEFVESQQALFVVDLSNPDAPKIASTMITDDSTAWWGDLKAIGNTLYATHYEWVTKADGTSGSYDKVMYYLDQIDLTDRSHPV